MNEVRARLEIAHYQECVKATLRTAERLGFTKVEQILLLGIEIGAEDQWGTAKLDILKRRSIDIEHRAEYLLNIAEGLESKFGGDIARMREWLETKQGKIDGGSIPRELMLSPNSYDTACVPLMLKTT